MLDMIKCSTGGAYYARGEWVPADGNAPAALAAKGFDAAAVENAKTGTMAYSILQAHNTSGDAENLKIKFDAMASHDITFVGIIQTARASGLEKFPIPYVLTNCHNSLCAVGGTINEDDHKFALSAAHVSACRLPKSTAASLCPRIWLSSTSTCVKSLPAAAK